MKKTTKQKHSQHHEKKRVLLSKSELTDSIENAIGFGLFMLFVALISPIPLTWALAPIYFLAAFCFAFLIGIVSFAVDHLLKPHFPEIYKNSAIYKRRYKRRRGS